MISRLIESKPEDLRVYIEEAAGISKYKERRRETENRMQRTLDNLDRLTDLREELERNLSHLKRQAQAAERYAEYKAEERELKAQLFALQRRVQAGVASRAQREIDDLRLSVSVIRPRCHRASPKSSRYGSRLRMPMRVRVSCREIFTPR